MCRREKSESRSQKPEGVERPRRGVDPGGGAVGPDLLFPDGDFGLEGVDEEAAGFEGFGAVGGGDGDHDGGLAEGDAAGAVEDGELEDGPALRGPLVARSASWRVAISG